MPKTNEELKKLRQEYELLATKLKELSDEELKEVIGGTDFIVPTNDKQYEHNLYKETFPKK